MRVFVTELGLLLQIVLINYACISKRLPSLTASNCELPAKMELYEIVPDAIDKAPKDLMKVKFVSGVYAAMGNQLAPVLTKDVPSVKYKADGSKLYTLCMTDPDGVAYEKPETPEWVHWLIVNIPGNNVNDGDVIDEYLGPGPQNGSGFHRYVWLAYQQPGKIVSDEPTQSKHEGKFRNSYTIRDFAKKYNLGQPVSGNFFLSEFDDYVPIQYGQITDSNSSYNVN